ncbi:CpaF family protein [Streptomyces xiamenensis]|uniref:CpaF family protein n=1 Tax=Streptomyces xiamenensis TaxID=408015 RepID=UPI0035D74E59
MPWESIEFLRGEFARRLVDLEQPGASEEEQREQARSLIRVTVAGWLQARSRTEAALTAVQEAAVEQAVFDAHYRAGPLQRYLDMPGAEEIYVDGTQAVLVDFKDRRERFPGLVATEQQLRELINRLATASGHGERRLTETAPVAHFRLPDRSRVAATLAPLSSRTSMVIRVHGALTAGLPDLRGWGAISGAMHAFLMSAVRARKSIVVAGAMRAGKTTMLRALAREVPNHETMVTLETDRELYLDEDQFNPDLAAGTAHVIALEERRSNGEDAGEITVRDLIPDSLRMGATRVIVGEVRDQVASEMLKATSAGGVGSMTTLHATSPDVVFPRLEQLCMEAGMSAEAARGLVATSLDLVVYIEQELNPRRRWVSHIWEVTPGESGPAVQPVFQPDPESGDPRGVPGHVPRCMPELAKVGLHSEWLTRPEYGLWDKPFDEGEQR